MIIMILVATGILRGGEHSKGIFPEGTTASDEYLNRPFPSIPTIVSMNLQQL